MNEELKPCPFCGGKASMNYERIQENIKDFGHRLSAIIATEEAVEYGRVLIMPQREKK